LTEAGAGNINDFRIMFSYLFIAETQFLHCSGLEILNQDISILRQFQKRLYSLLSLQIQRDAFFTTVEAEKVRAYSPDNGSIAPGNIAYFRPFNFNDFCTHIAEQHGSERAE
jgi:hypothetical protein